MSVYVISDLHGVYKLWEKIKNYLKPEDTLYILGDCADRGPDGWKIIKEVLKDPRTIYIRGNHDQFILDCWKSDWRDCNLWFYNGGYETYESIALDENAEIFLKELSKSTFYQCYINDKGQRFHLSHAGFTLLEGDNIPDNEDLLWDRYHIDDMCNWWIRENPNDYVVHGHTGCVSSIFKRNSIVMDMEFNKTKTLCRYAHGHKICIDGRSFISNKIAMLNLDTLKEIVFSI